MRTPFRSASILIAAVALAGGALLAAPAQGATVTRAPDVAAATTNWTVSWTGTCPSGTTPTNARVQSHPREANALGQLRARPRLVICVPRTTPAATPTATSTPTPAPTSIPTPTPAAETWRSDMLVRVNDVRAAKGLRALTLCAPIERAAQNYAELMASTGHFDHTGPDGSKPWDRMRVEGYQWASAGENIAYGYADVASVMQGWIDSLGHHANLVGTSFTHVGFGKAASPSGRSYWVQNFGSGGTC